jgi:hypothetical protein
VAEALHDPDRWRDRAPSRTLRLLASPSRWRARVAQLTIAALFVALPLVMVVPDATQLTTHVVGDGGDSLFIVWTLRWVDSALGGGWSALWNAPIYASTPNTLAYSDALLPVAVVFGVLWRASGSVALAVNVVALAAWTGTLWCTYRLAVRVGASTAGAVVAAVAFTFSTYHVAQHRHLQLVIGGLVVGVLLLALRFLDRPSMARSIGLSAAIAALAACSSYSGVIATVAVGVVVAPRLARPDVRRGAAIATVVLVALLAPLAVRYRVVTADPVMRRVPDHQFDVAPSDLIRGRDDETTTERWLYPGTVACGLAVVGLASARRWRADLVVLTVAGGVLLVLAFGDVAVIGDRVVRLPFSYLRGAMPGFDGVRVPARFAIVPLLVVALMAGVGATRLLRRWHPVVTAVVTGMLVAGVLLESFTAVESTVADPVSAVNGTVAARPPGIVVELPMRSSIDGAAWPFVEISRQLAAVDDRSHPRINGHSGYEPPGWPVLATTVNTFPSPEALAMLRQHDVRYVVLRTSLVIPPAGGRAQWYSRPGVGTVTDDQARRMIALVPRERLVRADKVGDAYLVELTARGR